MAPHLYVSMEDPVQGKAGDKEDSSAPRNMYAKVAMAGFLAFSLGALGAAVTISIHAGGTDIGIEVGEAGRHFPEEEPTVGKIINGFDEDPSKYPWFVHLGTCGAQLIAPNVVLTAGHCVDNGLSATVSFPGCSAGLQGVTVPSSSIDIHPQYNRRTISNDIALIFLPESVTCTPIAMATSTFWQAGTKVRAIGLGRIRGTPNVKRPDQLQGTVLTVTDPGRGGVVIASGDNTGICQGDSGGPLFIENRDSLPFNMAGPVLLGATSWNQGSDCLRFSRAGWSSVVFFGAWIRSSILARE